MGELSATLTQLLCVLCQSSDAPQLRAERGRDTLRVSGSHRASLHPHVDHVGGEGGHVQQLMQVPAGGHKVGLHLGYFQHR